MIVQCGQCNTKFRLDDAKVRDNGVRVRCSKCRHVFTVYREEPQADSDFEGVLNGFGAAAAEQVSPPADTQNEGPVTAEAPPFGFPDAAATPELPPGQSEGATLTDNPPPMEGFDLVDDSNTETTSEEKTFLLANDSGPAFDFSDSFEEEQVTAAKMSDVDSVAAGEIGYGAGDEAIVPEFDFQDAGDQPEKTVAPGHEGFGGPEEDDGFFLKAADMGSEISTNEDSLFLLQDETQPVVAPEAFAAAGAAGEPVETHSFEIGTEAAVEPSPDVTADELPPLTISSRRRSSTALPLIVTAISIIFVVILAVAGFYFLGQGPQALNKVGLGGVAEWAGLEQADAGKISIRGVTGAFMANKEAGELFVVTGEAVNDYRKPRASVQVRGLIYGPKGEVLARKTAYCGNVLTKEQLGTMPLAKMEAAMNNQFGDSLSNLGVLPGKGIPFVLVFTQVPKGASDYGIEVAGSTVASQ